jgi:pimeloyl-ACP methyl ester carboxylesterase
MRQSMQILALLTAASVGRSAPVRAAEPQVSTDRPFEQLGRALRPEWANRTLGGRWFWTDVFHNHGWRIQKHVLTGHHRLLDPRNVRHRSGRYADCVAQFEATVDVAERTRPVERAVIVVHGLGNWAACLAAHGKQLEADGYAVVPFEYPSNFDSIEAHAANLARVVASLPPTKRIDFVGHSMGGIVVRAYLATHADARFGRAVLLGTPNNGAEIAHTLRHSLLFDMACGPAAKQLIGGEGTFLASLAAPSIEFACIAGGRREIGYNPFIRGNDDGLVGVDAVRLAGAADFALVDANHHSLLYDDDVTAMTARFLRTGRLRASGEPQPIPAMQR